MSQPLTQGHSTLSALDRRLSGPQGWSGRCEKKIVAGYGKT